MTNFDRARQLPTSTLQEDLAVVADFFRIAPTGAEMQHLTGASRSQLGRAVQGEDISSRRAHIAVIGAFTRELGEILEQTTKSRPPQHGDMRGWLYGGRVDTTTGGTRTPWEVLADTEFAREALNELRNAARS